MIERAVWTGLAALLSVSLGSSLSLTASPTLARAGWLLVGVYAVAIVAVLPSMQGSPARRGATAAPSRLLLNLGAAIMGIASVALLWFLDGVWIAFVMGCPWMIGLTLLSAVFVPGRDPRSPEYKTEPGWLWRTARPAIDFLVVAVVLPLIGFTGAGASFAQYPWAVSVALVLPTLSFVVATHPDLLTVSDRGQHELRDKLLTFGMTLVSFCGVVVAGLLFPGSSEIRLLCISGAVVVAVIGLAAALHPSAQTGRRLATILVPASFLLMIIGFSVLYRLI
jgi:hypothetical protein